MNKLLEHVTINGKEFYKLEVSCPGKFNFDRPKPGRSKLRVKFEKGLKIKSVSISGNCPIYSVNAQFRRKKRIAILPYYCQKEDPLLYVKAYSQNGDTLIINNENINQFIRKRKLSHYCKCEDKPKEPFLGIFKVRQHYVYKKYKIYGKDFKEIRVKRQKQ